VDREVLARSDLPWLEIVVIAAVAEARNTFNPIPSGIHISYLSTLSIKYGIINFMEYRIIY
jgi:hypothetical protein